MKHHEFTDDEVKRIEENTERHVQERENRKYRYRYRASRKERIAAGKPEWNDCQNEDDVVCPRCGHWAPGGAGKSWAAIVDETDVYCKECGEIFHCTIRVTYNYTTTLRDVDEKFGEGKDLPRI